ncbi:hypothetical protein C1T17_00210 [Sphingobium sp. SCG-1]|uniref:hypothetical protein n=1 Tax=Sphingobium sp. SCG-1 TaxID=2072936 RepID=UPI000CD69FE6|nr:hypothetical protein [Sphingobium sp. SCG-1]AUW56738.1 hypothetical protein C1T17_00210 [Sphingobium sp. SCG-1]
MKSLLALVLISLVSSTAAVARPSLSLRNTEVLNKALEGKTPGPPVRCVSRDLLNDMRSVGNSIMLYRVGPKLTYRNDLGGQCHGLGSDGIPVLQSFGGEYCRGDIIRIADRQTGGFRGSCVLGPFVPYRASAK